MMTVEFSQAAIHGDSLRLGVVVRYGEGGPVRFAQVVIDQDALDWGSLTDIVMFAQQQMNRHLDREREVADDVALPGL